MSKGTILYVGNFELPDKGASANRVMNNRKLFSSLGYRVVMLGIAHDKFDGIRTVSYDEDIYEEAYPITTVNWARHMASIRNIAELAEKYSDTKMVLLYNAPYLLVKNCKHYFHKKNIKVCYDCTEWTPVTDGTLPKRLVKKWDCRFIQSKLGKVIDGLIVVSRLMQKHYQEQDKLLYLPPLVDVEDEIWHPKHPHIPKKFEFCFAGILDGDKDSLDVIIEAFCKAECENAQLRIIGVTEEEFLRYYPTSKALLERLGDSVLFMGRISHQETIRYILGCGCYIFVRKPDLRNNAGFPTKFTEAYTSGVQLITTSISNIADYKNVAIQILPTTDCNSIAGAICRATNLRHRSSMRNEFDFRSYIGQTETFLRTAIEATKGRKA